MLQFAEFARQYSAQHVGAEVNVLEVGKIAKLRRDDAAQLEHGQVNPGDMTGGAGEAAPSAGSGRLEPARAARPIRAAGSSMERSKGFEFASWNLGDTGAEVGGCLWQLRVGGKNGLNALCRFGANWRLNRR